MLGKDIVGVDIVVRDAGGRYGWYGRNGTEGM